MGIMGALNRNPKTAIYVIGGLIVVSAAFGVMHARQPSGPRPVSEGLVYYTTDDGKTWFPDSITKPSP